MDRAFEAILEEAGNVPNVRYLGTAISDDAGFYVQQRENGGYNIHTEMRVIDVQTDSDGVAISSTGTRDFSVWQDSGTKINSVLNTNDGGYVMAGKKRIYELPPSGQPFDWSLMPDGVPKGSETYLLKTNASGVEVWSNAFLFANETEHWSDPSYEIHSEIQNVYPALDGGYILVAAVTSEDNQNVDLNLIKTDDYGNEIWSKKYGDSQSWYAVKDLIQTYDGGYIILGNSSKGDTYNSNLFLIEIDNSGNEIWNKNYPYENGFYSSFSSKIQKTADGNYLLSANSYSLDGVLIKLDTSGNEVWRKSYPASYRLADIKKTTDGGYMTLGSKTLIKHDSQGEVVWEKSYVGEFTHGITSVTNTSDGGYILVGGTGGQQVGPAVYVGWDIWLIKTDSSGNEIWSKKFDLGANERGSYVFPTPQGGFVLIGIAQPEIGIYFIKVDGDGIVIE